VFLLDGLMSFPSRLPAHWMAFCVMQGMAMGLARDRAAGADDAEDQRPVPASRWIVPAILLGLCLVALPHQYRRVAAEWHLKSARTTADSALVMRSGVPGSMWDHLQFIQEEMVAAWASGKDGLLEALLEAGAQAAQTPVLQQVVRHLEQADKLAPRYTNASSRRSVVLMASGQWREAGDLLDRIMLDLQSPEILDRRAFCHVMTGGFQQAADLWTELAKRQPRAAERHMLLAARAAELGRTKNSADHAVREDTPGPAATPSTE
jgi:tetratricopeptide (TPR) repeat protein